MADETLCHRTARRLTRLFRLERRGRFDRLPAEIAQQLVHRRGILIRELQACGAMLADRRELDRALRELAREVDCSRAVAEQRRDDLIQEIRFRSHTSSGLRGGMPGQLLGRG